MNYQVKLTEYATEQVSETISYIRQTLLSPESALAWADRLKFEMASLSFMPQRYAIIDREPWKSDGVRKMTVRNFLVYYYIAKETVWIIAVIYGRRDQLSALREIPRID